MFFAGFVFRSECHWAGLRVVRYAKAGSPRNEAFGFYQQLIELNDSRLHRSGAAHLAEAVTNAADGLHVVGLVAHLFSQRPDVNVDRTLEH